VTKPVICLFSVVSDFRNLSLAGRLKNKSSTLTRVPAAAAIEEVSAGSPPSMVNFAPTGFCRVFVIRVNRETEPIEASASPLKPRVWILKRSSARLSLLVACRETASANSSAGIPLPSSVTWIKRLPACITSISIFSAPASMAFSRSSFTTEAGLSTTSPAAIWEAIVSGRILMGIFPLVRIIPTYYIISYSLFIFIC